MNPTRSPLSHPGSAHSIVFFNYHKCEVMLGLPGCGSLVETKFILDQWLNNIHWNSVITRSSGSMDQTRDILAMVMKFRGWLQLGERQAYLATICRSCFIEANLFKYDASF